MSNAHDRRAPGTSRIPFDAMVEVGGALGPSFEAQAVNLSEEGMSLRTAYLPEVGQPVMCRFDAGPGMAVVAAGEVLWKDDMGDGGEFGIRFTNLDGQSTVALQRILGMVEDGQGGHIVVPGADPGRKVRLHIEGLASPMRARIKTQEAAGVTAYSELGFLQMGKPLELEDAASGNRRPAMIDRVEVEIDSASRVPQLVVSLRYDDEDGRAAAASMASMSGMAVPVHSEDEMDEMEEHPNPTPHDPPTAEDMQQHVEAAGRPGGEKDAAQMAEAKAMPSDDEESHKLKSAFARSAAKVTPALLAWMKRAKATAALMAAKARAKAGESKEGEAAPVRRTTAPAPGGGLHAAGRRVVRGSMPEDRFEQMSSQLDDGSAGGRFKITKKKIAVAGSIGVALLLVFIALRKPSPAPQLASPPGEAANTASTASSSPAGRPTPPPSDPLAQAAAAMGNSKKPFTNGPVGAHPTVIKIKMDGTIDGIQGAPQPTGFTVVIPNRKSMEPVQALAEKDPRIAAISVANEQGGAEFSVTFKDGVPNYLVRAHGDTLEMVLAKGSSKAEAHAPSKKGGKHSKKH